MDNKYKLGELKIEPNALISIFVKSVKTTKNDSKIINR